MKSLEEYHNSLPYRKNNDERFGNVLLKMLEVYGLKDKMMEFRIRKYWNDEMGPTICNYTKSVFVKNRRVFIQLTSASLRQELSYAKEKIKKLLNEYLGEDYVEEIITV
jgi:hypothetical protein